MYKVLFADDEYLTRNSIAKNTHWEEADFTLIGTAENGREAITIIEEEHPELVITDICMPIMDGLELSEYIHENHPEIKVIILSGYDDFEYAKKALKYEVVDYILKPITSIELLEELEKIREKLDSTKEKKIQVEKIRHEYEKNKPTLRNFFLRRLIEGTYRKHDIEEQMEHFGIKLAGKRCAVALVELEDASEFLKQYPDTKEDLIEFSVDNITGEQTEKEPDILYVKNADNKCICIFTAEDDTILQERTGKVGREIVDAMWKYMRIKVSVVVGETVTGPENWAYSFNSAINASEYRFILEDRDLVYAGDFNNHESTGFIQPSTWIEKLVLLIRIGQEEDIIEAAKEMFKEFRASGCEKKTILLHVQNIVLTIIITLADSNDEIEREEEEASFIHHLSDYKHLSEVEVKFTEFCCNVAKSITSKRESTNRKQAIMALDYIEKNYMNVNMSLNMVCSYLCVSTSYFSTIFKNATGETFIETLTRVRMEKAKKLLETTNMKSYEVALSVGYNDPHYFSSIFKKHLGMTPTEYAKKERENQ